MEMIWIGFKMGGLQEYRNRTAARGWILHFIIRGDIIGLLLPNITVLEGMRNIWFHTCTFAERRINGDVSFL